MLRLSFVVLILTAFMTTCAIGQTREQKVRNDREKVEGEGYWIYNDLPKAFAQAEKTGQPIVVVLRCIPCEECVRLDDELIDADERLKPLLEQFVRVRVVSTNGLDLSLFQFDTDQSFAMFLLNADGTIYGRFGTRSHRTNWVGDVSIEGMAKALEGALAVHKEYPKNKSELTAKRGRQPEFARPEQFPPFKNKYKSQLDYEGQVVASCIHCHQIGDAMRELALARPAPLSETLLFPYPHPKTLGLILDPKEMATVMSVEEGSDADQAGFKAGDTIRALAGQPLLSIADVQWVLQSTSPEGSELKADVIRAEQPIELTLRLDNGWRQRDDISWRASTWELRRRALGGMYLVKLSHDEHNAAQLSPTSMALRVQHVGKYAPHDIAHRAGIRDGDIVVAFDTHTDLLRETDLIAYSLWQKKPGDQVTCDILRDGARKSLTITLAE